MTMEQELTMDKGGSPAPGKPISVTVTAHPPGSRHPFTQSWSEEGGSKHEGTIRCDGGTGARPITFELDDQSGTGLSFAGVSAPGKAGDAKKAMYVALSGCPTVEGNGGQIRFGAPPSKTQLAVVNLNQGDPCDLYYQLNFVDGKGAPQPYDPIIKNGGDSV